MKTVSSIANEKGGVTLLLFHCYFNSSESLTHFMHDLDHSLYSELPYLYSVCIADNSTNNKKITAAFSIKTLITMTILTSLMFLQMLFQLTRIYFLI